MVEPARRYESLDELEAVVRGFESCDLRPSDFTHEAHLTVALWYLSEGRTVPLAAERMRAGLFRYLDRHGPGRDKYNETITLFWIKLLRKFLDETEADRSIVETANEVSARFRDSKLIFDYYSRERLFSDKAKSAWVEPDLKPPGF
ncbi:MAG TPA: hypothetical protein VF708_16255 [Pyrinomonadaceae bacterium]|jgi:hypothetical protein